MRKARRSDSAGFSVPVCGDCLSRTLQRKKMAGQGPPFLIFRIEERPLFRDQIYRRGLAALIDFQFELQLVPFFEPAHTGTFDS